MKRLFLGLIVALAWALAYAAPARAAERLTLPAAVDAALRGNPAILQAQAQSDAAAAARREVRALRLPHVQVREVALQTDAPADAFGLTLMQERFDFGAFTASNPNDPEPVDNFATEFEAVWPIFVGGRVMAGLDQTMHMAKAADAQRIHTREAIALSTASAYMDAVLAERATELAQRARDTTARHVAQAQDFYDAGMMVESDLLQARVQLARMDENLIRARHGARTARAHLFRMMGVEQDADYELDPDVTTADPGIADIDTALAGAFARRHDIRAVEAQVNATRSGVKRARGEYFPEVALVGRYSLNDDQIFGSNGESYMVMAVASWNVLTWGQTNARVSGARAQQVAAEEGQRAHRQAVEFEVRNAWQQAIEARARHEVTAGAVVQAERALAIVEDRFGQGIVKVSDLLDAETLLDEARVRELNARFDAQRAARTLSFVTGLPPVPEVSR
jgi:outer membrane protein TolC